MALIRPPAVAGQFYPANERDLSSAIEKLIDEAPYNFQGTPKALIIPHAGLIYSGPVAATAYRYIRDSHRNINRIILLGPCHRVGVKGLALSNANFFQTPLGNIEIDKKSISKIKHMPEVHFFDETHALEHSLEIHLPFLQKILNNFKLVPIVVGDSSAKAVADVLLKVWGGEETLIIVSSDLSHYKSYHDAKKIDAITCRAIESLNRSIITRDNACGLYPLNGLLKFAEQTCMSVKTLDIRNSGDTAGSKSKVVGYGSWIFLEQKTLLGERDDQKGAVNITNSILKDAFGFETDTKEILKQYGLYLLLLASKSIEYGLIHGHPIKISINHHPKPIQKKGASFITLKQANQLRGCIGSPIANHPLVMDVINNAYKAAFNDPRFKILQKQEFEKTSISISILSPPSKIKINSEDDLLANLRPFVDGLIIRDLGKQSLFLPSVWQQLQNPEDFLLRLKLKAGLTGEHWSKTFSAERFTAEEISFADVINK